MSQYHNHPPALTPRRYTRLYNVAMKRSTAFSLFFLFIGLTFSWSPVHAFEDGEAVMQAAYQQGRQHDTQRAEVELVIKDNRGKKRVRRFRLWHKIFPDRTKSLMKFYRPASVKGTGLLSETLDQADNATQWIYLPALRSVKLLNADEQNDSFVGSDFTNGDIAGRQVSRDRHEITGQDEKKIYIRSIPRDAGDFYSKLEVEMLRDILVPAKITFYDHSGKKLKTLTNQRIRKVKNMYLVVEAEMLNHQSGGSTTLTKNAIDLGIKIDEHRVGIKGLRM